MSGAAGKDLNIQERTPLLGNASRFNSIALPYYLGAGAVNVGCWALGGYGIYSTVTHRPIDALKLALSIATALAPTLCNALCCKGVKPTKLPEVEPSPSKVEAGQGKKEGDLTDLIARVRMVISDEKYQLFTSKKEVNALPASKALLSQQIELLISLLASVDGRAQQLNTTLAETQRQLTEKVRLLQEKESAPVQSAPVIDIDAIKKAAVEAALRPITDSFNLLLSDARFQKDAACLTQELSENLETFVSRQAESIKTLLMSLLDSAQQSEQELNRIQEECKQKVEELELKVEVLLYGRTARSPAIQATPSPAASPATPAASTSAQPSPVVQAESEELLALKGDVFQGIKNLKLSLLSPSSQSASTPASPQRATPIASPAASPAVPFSLAPESPAPDSPTFRTPAAVGSAPARPSSLRNEVKPET